MKRYTVTQTIYDLDLETNKKVVRRIGRRSYWTKNNALMAYINQVLWANGDAYGAEEVVVELKDRYTGKKKDTSFQYTDEEKAQYWIDRYRDWSDDEDDEED